MEAFKISNIPTYKLQEAKDALYTEFALGMTDTLSLADVFSRDEILGLGFDYYTKYDKILSAVTFLEILEASKEFMLPDKKSLISVSSSNSSDLVYENKRLSFKAPKEPEVSKDTKDNSKTNTNAKDSSNKDVSNNNFKESGNEPSKQQ